MSIGLLHSTLVTTILITEQMYLFYELVVLYTLFKKVRILNTDENVFFTSNYLIKSLKY